MKVLVVEDTEDSRYLLEKILQAYGHEVIATANGAEALEQALAQPPDIIVSDILMPKMDGFQLCHEWKQNKQLKDIPFVFYTATYTLDEDKKFALSLGADTFLVKPTEPDVLVQKLSEVFEKAKSGALAPPEVAPLEPSLFLTEYTKRIVAKLDKKVAQLEESEKKLKYIGSVLRAIRTINQLIIRERDRAKLLQGACEILIKVREYRFAWIGLIEEGHKRVLPVAKAGVEEGYLDSVKITWDDTETGKGPTGTAIKTKQPALIRNILEDQRFKPWREEALKRGYLSSAVIPLVRDEKVYGVLNVYSSERDGFNDEEANLLVEVGGDIAFALHGMELEQERKLAEEALKENKEKLQRMFESATDGIVVTDLNGNIMEVNEAAVRLRGSDSKEKLIGQNTFEFIAEKDRVRVMEILKNALEDGQIRKNVEITFLTEDGREYFAEVNSALLKDAAGNPAGFIAMFRDITERKRAEERIKHAAEEWRTTFDSITDLISICDKDFKLARVNKAFADAFKMKPVELIGKHCYEIIHGTNESIPNCPQKVTIKTKKPAMVEFFEPHLGIHLEMSTSPIFNEKGEVVACVHVTRDITERKKMEEQLIVTDRLASVGELASGIAHELNNPLTSVIGFSQLLLEKDVPDDVREDLKIIHSEAQRTAQVVKNLLTFARKHDTEKGPMNINSIMEKVLELRAYEQRVSNIQVNTRFALDLPEIMADYFQLQQVFLNIVINAEHFMIESNNRGTLTITTEKVEDIIRASFADDGPGISKENLGHLFDPFFTTKAVGKGTGLGLSICHGIITEHGGRIYAESKLGKGATFVVELPITTDKKGTVK